MPVPENPEPSSNQSQSPSGSSGSSSNSCESSSGSESEASQVGEANWPERVSAREVEGARLTLETCSEPVGQNYHCFCVACPLGSSTHYCPGKALRQKRNVGHCETADSGPLAPVAYLAVLSYGRSRFQARDAHVNFNPSKEQVRIYMYNKGWHETS